MTIVGNNSLNKTAPAESQEPCGRRWTIEVGKELGNTQQKKRSRHGKISHAAGYGLVRAQFLPNQTVHAFILPTILRHERCLFAPNGIIEGKDQHIAFNAKVGTFEKGRRLNAIFHAERADRIIELQPLTRYLVIGLRNVARSYHLTVASALGAITDNDRKRFAVGEKLCLHVSRRCQGHQKEQTGQDGMNFKLFHF